jgi:hypothetical protein
MANAFIFANNVNTTLGASAASSALTMTLASSANLPTLASGQVMPLTLNDAATGLVYEIVYVTAISGATLTVIRAQEGTTAQNWSTGDYAACMHTAQSTAAMNGNAAETFEAAPAVGADDVVNLGQMPKAYVVFEKSSSAVTSMTVSVSFTAPQNGVVLIKTAGSAGGGAALGLNTFSSTGATAETGDGGETIGNDTPTCSGIGYYSVVSGAAVTFSLTINISAASTLYASISALFIPTP